jgi:nitrite reductase/ring-hydroxylating ferredoxin subunit
MLAGRDNDRNVGRCLVVDKQQVTVTQRCPSSSLCRLFSYISIQTPSTALNMAKFKSKLQYVPCIPVEDLPSPGSATSGVAGGLAICIAVDPKGSVYALGDKCPPVNQPLSFGKVNADGTIQDPVLGTKFSLKTGDVVGPWCPSGIGRLIGGAFSPIGVPTYPVKKSGKFIEVQVDVNAKANFEANYWSGILDAQGKADGKYY